MRSFHREASQDYLDPENLETHHVSHILRGSVLTLRADDEDPLPGIPSYPVAGQLSGGNSPVAWRLSPKLNYNRPFQSSLPRSTTYFHQVSQAVYKWKEVPSL